MSIPTAASRPNAGTSVAQPLRAVTKARMQDDVESASQETHRSPQPASQVERLTQSF
jgi:hypothetical protein